MFDVRRQKEGAVRRAASGRLSAEVARMEADRLKNKNPAGGTKLIGFLRRAVKMPSGKVLCECILVGRQSQGAEREDVKFSGN